MDILEALLGVGRAIVRGSQSFAAGVIIEIIREVDRSPLGKIIAGGLSTFSTKYLNTARDMAKEEAELAQKASRDGKASESDLERAREIAAAREVLKTKFNAAKAQEAAEKLKSSDVVAVPSTSDEISSVAGIVTLNKDCPSCGSPMRIRQSGYKAQIGKRHFWWQCTKAGTPPCPSIRLDPETYGAQVIRPPNPDLDGPEPERRKIWTNERALVQTHRRLRSHLGDEDVEMVCPDHVLPMKLLQRRTASGRLLDSYEYVCPGINADGHACDQSVAVETYPQVADALRCAEGEGIIAR